MFINGWTKESFFGKIKEKNGWQRCADYDGACLYRNDEDGTACFVGAFIPDNEYEERFEQNSLDMLTEKEYGVDLDEDVVASWMPLSLGHMNKLQNIHDDHQNEGKLKEVVTDYLLKEGIIL